ncbi:MAG: hypothetical protein V4598_12895 [Bdellovibrionota bacterium]
MTTTALIIGNGISGLLLALTLARKQWDVTVVSQPSSDPGDSPLICPEIVMDFLEELIPGSRSDFIKLGARHSSHEEMIREKFPHALPEKKGEFFFMGRKLLIDYLYRHAMKAGIIFCEENTASLMTNENKVIGISTENKNITANYVFDCTGTFRSRSAWLKGLVRTGEIVQSSGREEVMFLRFYESSQLPHLRLRSGEEFRGGIYPMEGNRFAVSMIVPAQNVPQNPETILNRFISFIGGEVDFKGSTPSGNWIKRDHIINRASNFYLSGLTSELQNFYVVGDGLLFSNPVYGRGISLTVLQLRSIRSPETLATDLKSGFRNALKKWSEVAKEKNSVAHKILRKYYLYLLERDPVTYELFLEFYQLRMTPVELLKGILLSPVSLRILILLVLILSGLTWASAFFPR